MSVVRNLLFWLYSLIFIAACWFSQPINGPLFQVSAGDPLARGFVSGSLLAFSYALLTAKTDEFDDSHLARWLTASIAILISILLISASSKPIVLMALGGVTGGAGFHFLFSCWLKDSGIFSKNREV